MAIMAGVGLMVLAVLRQPKARDIEIDRGVNG
jgi:hypothetical protein